VVLLKKKGILVPNLFNLSVARLKQGYVLKEGMGNTAWRKRNLLQKQGTILLNKIRHVQLLDYKAKTNVFAIVLETRTYFIQGSSAKDSKSWVNSINTLRDFFCQVPENVRLIILFPMFFFIESKNIKIFRLKRKWNFNFLNNLIFLKPLSVQFEVY